MVVHTRNFCTEGNRGLLATPGNLLARQSSSDSKLYILREDNKLQSNIGKQIKLQSNIGKQCQLWPPRVHGQASVPTLTRAHKHTHMCYPHTNTQSMILFTVNYLIGRIKTQARD